MGGAGGVTGRCGRSWRCEGKMWEELEVHEHEHLLVLVSSILFTLREEDV